MEQSVEDSEILAKLIQSRKNHWGVSIYHGLTYHKGQWRARFTCGGKEYKVGYFDDDVEAAQLLKLEADRLRESGVVLKKKFGEKKRDWEMFNFVVKERNKPNYYVQIDRKSGGAYRRLLDSLGVTDFFVFYLDKNQRALNFRFKDWNADQYLDLLKRVRFDEIKNYKHFFGNASLSDICEKASERM